jgi:hypothetical protein
MILLIYIVHQNIKNGWNAVKNVNNGKPVMAISKDEDNKTLCSAFWRHTNVRGDNTVFPCCRYKQSVATFTGNVSEILTSSVYDKLRQDSASGVINPNCEKCYHEESIGTTSMRQFFNNKYVTTKVELEFLEIGFDNIVVLDPETHGKRIYRDSRIEAYRGC